MSETYYSKYWSAPETAIPNGDPSVSQRVSLAAPHIASKDVLDYGCAAGVSTRLLAAHARSVVGIDIAQSAIDMANRLPVNNVEYLVGALEAVKAMNRLFDAVFLGDVLEHLYDCVDALQVLRKYALRPGGLAVITVPYYGFLKVNAVLWSGSFGAHFDPMGPHVRFFDFGSLRRTLFAAGFEVLTIRGYGRPIPYLHRGIFAVARAKSE